MADKNLIDLANQTQGKLPTAAGGVPAGGSTGQVLTKNSSADYDDSWAAAGGAAPTGTGFVHITAGVEDAAARAVAIDSASDTSMSNVTVNDVNTSKHGFAPKAPNDVTRFLDGTGAYSTPAAGSISGGFAWGGDGSDGGVTFDGSSTVLGLAPSSSVYTLTRDLVVTSMVVNSGVTVKTGNFMIFCTGTVTVNGTVMNDGQNGANGTNASNQVGGPLGAGGTQSSTSTSGTFPRGGIGVAAASSGASGGSGAGSQASAPGTGGTSTQLYANGGLAGNNGGNGGAGGSGSGGTNAGGAARSGGTGGATPSNSGRLPDARTPLRAITFQSSQGTGGGAAYLNSYNAISGGASGGSSGGGDGTNLGRGGGGGGGQGGHAGALLIAAKNIVVGASGLISCKGATGGNGGNGGSGATGNVGGGGGGAGGGGGDGGVIFLIYQSLTNSGSIVCSAGSGGTHGTGSSGAGTGAAGSNGQDGPNGNAGIVIQIAC